MTTVRPLSCPHCGGKEFSFPDKGRCRCLACRSEFLLDETPKPSPARPSGGAGPRRLAALCFLLLLLAGLLYALAPAPAPQPASQPARQRAATPAVTYELQQLALAADPTRDGAPLVLRVRGDLGQKGPAGYVADCYDPRTQAWSEETQRLQDAVGKNAREIRFQAMSDGSLFLVLDKSRLFSFDFAARQWVDARPLLERQPRLAGGVVQIEIGYANEGDALRVMTADGTRRYFYPAVDLAPTYDELRRMVADYRHPQAERRHGFTFARKGAGTSGPQQLIRYAFLDNKTGPRLFGGYLEWDGEGQARHIKRHAHIFRQAHLEATDFFTPDRVYYRASVAWADKEDLLIRFRPTPHPDAPSLLQSLDPEDGAIRWTLQGNFDGELVKTADGFYLLQGAKLFRISEGRRPLAEPQRLF